VSEGSRGEGSRGERPRREDARREGSVRGGDRARRPFLPWEWWKLSLLWFLNLKTRTPPLRRKGLLRNSIVASTLGLSLSVAALSLTLAIVTGFQKSLALSVSRELGDVTYYSRWRYESAFRPLAAHFEKQGDVARSVLFWKSQGLVVGPKGGRGVLVEGESQFYPARPPGHLTQGVTVVLGRALAEYLGVQVGSQIRLLLPGILRASIQARVVELRSYGMYDIDSRYVLLDSDQLSAYLRRLEPDNFASRPGDGHGMKIFLKKSHPVDVVEGAELERRKQEFRGLIKAIFPDDDEPLVQGWAEQKKNFFGGILFDKAILSVILGLLTLVGVLNIAATLVVLFLERDREMATLRALGLSPQQMRAWITIQAFLLGIFSSLCGLGIARLGGNFILRLPWAKLPQDIYNLREVPLHYDFLEQAAVFGFGVVSSVLIGILLGHLLAKQNFLEALSQRR